MNVVQGEIAFTSSELQTNLMVAPVYAVYDNQLSQYQLVNPKNAMAFLAADVMPDPIVRGVVAEMKRRAADEDVRQIELGYNTVARTRTVTKYADSRTLYELLRSNPSRELLVEVEMTMRRHPNYALWARVLRAVRTISQGEFGKVMKSHLAYPKDDIAYVNTVLDSLKRSGTDEEKMTYLHNLIAATLEREKPHAVIKEAIPPKKGGDIHANVADLHHESLILRELRPLRNVFTTLPAHYLTAPCAGGSLTYDKNILVTCSDGGAREVPYVVIEYIEGVTMQNAIADLKPEELLMTLAVLHNFLSRAWELYGFVHGDLHLNNIILKGYGKGELYEVPLIDPATGASQYLIMPFVPVIVDFGMAGTTINSWLSWGIGPRQMPASDIYRIYSILRQVSEITGKAHPVAVTQVLMELDKYIEYVPKFNPYGPIVWNEKASKALEHGTIYYKYIAPAIRTSIMVGDPKLAFSNNLPAARSVAVEDTSGLRAKYELAYSKLEALKLTGQLELLRDMMLNYTKQVGETYPKLV